MEQRLDEWVKNYNDDYFNRQFENPYRSTIKFCDWLESLGLFKNVSGTKFLDMCTGKGSNVYYMYKRFPKCKFLGLDINDNFIKEGRNFLAHKNIKNCNLEYGDLYNLDIKKHINQFEGILSYQTLSWLPEYETAINEMIKLNPKWIALSSLFYDGLVDCKIEIKEYNNSIDKASSNNSFYNVYSIPRIKNFFSERGYTLFKYSPFEIDIDLPKPKHSHMQTYTKKLEDNSRIQISGPLLMNWYFIYASKE